MKTIINYLIIGVILVIGVMFSTGMFSVIGEMGSSKEVCNFKDVNGGSCVFNLTLPEYRELQDYKLNLTFESVPGIYSNYIELNSFASESGVYEHDMEDYYRERDLDTYRYYFYRVPEITEDVYIMKFFTEAQGSVKAKTNSADGEISGVIKFINKPYSSNSISKCTTEDSCSGSNYIIEEYSDKHHNRPSNKEIRLNSDLTLSCINKERIETDDLTTISGKINYTGFIYTNTLNSFGINDTKDLLIVVEYKVEEEPYYYVDWNLENPKLYFSYAERSRPDYVTIKVGDDILQDNIRSLKETNISSKNIGSFSVLESSYDNDVNVMTTNNMANLINKYCSRETNTSKCVVPITIESQSAGKIYIGGELSKMIARTDYIPPIVETIEEDSSEIPKEIDYGFKNRIINVLIFLTLISFIVLIFKRFDR